MTAGGSRRPRLRRGVLQASPADPAFQVAQLLARSLASGSSVLVIALVTPGR
jgi:hypothetical protein